MKNNVLSITVGIAGALLCIAGTTHFFQVHQSSGDARTPSYTGVTGRHLSEVSEAELKIGSREPPLHFASRINMLVHTTTYHCAPSDYAFSPIERLAIWADLPSAMGSEWSEGPTSRAQLRCGYCHQQAIALAQILRKNGFDAWAYGLNGHVVTRVDLGGAIYILDPDYGVPPFRYNVFGDIFQETIKAYETSVVMPGQPSPPDTSPGDRALTPEQIASFVASTDDNQFYSTPEHWDAIDAARKSFKRDTNIIALMLILIGILGLVCGTKTLGKNK